MKPFATAAVCLALALLTFFQFPGHTWLQQDSQIYVPILEHLRDPAVLRNDILVQHPHVAFTLYDETALALRAVTRAGFREVLAAQQIATRALGIWGLLLMAQALGLTFAPALLVASICSLGALISGPSVLTFEYEPTPRAFAVPLLLCAIGLAAHRRYLARGSCRCRRLPLPSTDGASVLGRLFPLRRVAAPVAACTSLSARPARRRSGDTRGRGYCAIRFRRCAAHFCAARFQPGVPSAHAHGIRLDLHLAGRHHRASSVGAVRSGGGVRARPSVVGVELRVLLLGLAALGVLSMPLSWLFLEHFRWGLVPQVQPLRVLLFLTLGMQFFTAAAGARAIAARRPVEALAWLTFAYLLPLQPVLTGPFVWTRVALAIALASVTAFARCLRRNSLGARRALAAFFAIPWFGGVVNYPQLHTPDLAGLSAWARANTRPRCSICFPRLQPRPRPWHLSQ